MKQALPETPLPHLCVVIPMYKARDQIADVLGGVPEFVQTIVVVDDWSPDDSYKQAQAVSDPRVQFARHTASRFVAGGARCRS